MQKGKTAWRSKLHRFIVRFNSSVAIMASFLAVVWGGHLPLAGLTLTLEVRCESGCACHHLKSIILISLVCGQLKGCSKFLKFWSEVLLKIALGFYLYLDDTYSTACRLHPVCDATRWTECIGVTRIMGSRTQKSG